MRIISRLSILVFALFLALAPSFALAITAKPAPRTTAASSPTHRTTREEADALGRSTASIASMSSSSRIVSGWKCATAVYGRTSRVVRQPQVDESGASVSPWTDCRTLYLCR